MMVVCGGLIVLSVDKSPVESGLIHQTREDYVFSLHSGVIECVDHRNLCTSIQKASKCNVPIEL